MSKQEKYNPDKIITLKGTDAIRTRPGMYIGALGPAGVMRLFFEAVGNAFDEYNAGRCESVLIKINEKTSEIQISDNGVGIPPNKIEEVCTKLHSSGKFSNDYSKFSIGQNGVGCCVINALSESLVILVKRDGYLWEQKFSKGKVLGKLEKKQPIEKSDGTGTTLSFIPDIEIFNDITIDIDKYVKFIELSAYMNKGLEIQLVIIDKNGKKSSRKITSKNGLSDYISILDNKFLLKKPIIISDIKEEAEVIKTKDSKGKIKETKTGNIISMETEIVLQYSKNDTGIIKTYCNGLETIEGGSHETGARMALSEVFKKAVTSSNLLTKKDNNIEILPEDILEGIVILINIKHSNPTFRSQTKDALNVEAVKWFVKKTLVEGLNKWLNSNSTQAKIVYQRIIMAAKGRMAASRAKNAKKKESNGLISGLSALSKVTLATGDDPKNKRIFVVEGENCSLKSFLIAGIICSEDN